MSVLILVQLYIINHCIGKEIIENNYSCKIKPNLARVVNVINTVKSVKDL